MDRPHHLGQSMTASPIADACFTRETALHAAGYEWVAGIDEVGRGPIAGPVVAAAVVLDPAAVPAGLRDSKKLTADRRRLLFGQIMATAHVGIAAVPAHEIDRINIRQATLMAMIRAWHALPLAARRTEKTFALVDGNDPPALPCGIEAIVGGDGIVASIAAASIVAKVTRDSLMQQLGMHYPAYGFDAHVGYPTERHRGAIRDHGPCPFHRFSFASLRK